MSSMELIGKKYNTDKILHHKYDELYELYGSFINKFYNTDGGIIEICVEKFSSIKTWIDLFKNIHIYGFNINIDNYGEKHVIVKGDQSKELDLNNFISIITKPIYFIMAYFDF